MPCLEVQDIPSAASSDDLGVLVAQHASVKRVLLLSHGPGTPGTALVWLTGCDAAVVADALDSHPLAGGLLSTRVCEDPMRWVVSSVGSASRDGGGSVDNGRNGGFTAAAANASDGVSALEAELRDVQAQLQARAAEGGFGTWEDSGESSCDNVEGGWDWRSEGSSGGSSVGWQQAGQRRGGQSRRGASASAATGSPAKSGRKIVVQNIAPELVHSQLLPFFKQFGHIEELIKRCSASFVFVHFQEPADAAAAIHAISGSLVPELNPAGEVRAELRDPAQAKKIRQLHGDRSMDSQEPTTKLWVGNVASEATMADLARVFGRFGPVYALELRRAAQADSTDQFGWVNFRRLEDAEAAVAALELQPVPQLSRRLKVRYRPV